MNEDLEKSLRAAMRREPAPPDFAAKILARTSGLAVVSTATRTQRWRHPLAIGLAAALLLSVPALQMERHRSETAKAMKAKQDLLIALAITRDQLQHAREKLQRTGRNTQ